MDIKDWYMAELIGKIEQYGHSIQGDKWTKDKTDRVLEQVFRLMEEGEVAMVPLEKSPSGALIVRRH